MTSHYVPIALFRIGRLVATPNALRCLDQTDILRGMERHCAADWGDLTEEDRRANDCALENGGRLVSVYHSSEGVKFYVITEADRSATTVLLPEDY
ncbi:MAG TPA: hypothetical protein VGR89_01585 [Puia sp.]|nr:hypothetical protein [Puia sp.]